MSDPLDPHEEVVSVRLPIDLLRRLDASARQDQRSRSSAIRRAITEWCDRRQAGAQ